MTGSASSAESRNIDESRCSWIPARGFAATGMTSCAYARKGRDKAPAPTLVQGGLRPKTKSKALALLSLSRLDRSSAPPIGRRHDGRSSRKPGFLPRPGPLPGGRARPAASGFICVADAEGDVIAQLRSGASATAGVGARRTEVRQCLCFPPLRCCLRSCGIDASSPGSQCVSAAISCQSFGKPRRRQRSSRTA
jgi:hypothetical protein